MKLQFLHKKVPFSCPEGMLNLVMDDTMNSYSMSVNHLDNLPDSTIKPDGNFFKAVKGKVFLVIFFLIFSVVGYSQTTFSFGVSGGYDHNFNYLTGLTNTTSSSFPDFNFGVDGILNIGEKMRIRAELKYSNMNLTRNWNFNSQDLTRFDKSVLYISNLDLCPRFDYKLLTTGKFDLYASAGFHFEFNLGNYERSTLANGDKLTTNLMSRDFTKTQAGAVGGLILKYNVNPSFGITLAPDYTYFFDQFSTKNDYNMQRIGMNLGVEWKF
jgi:hypothetical protein